MHAWLPGPGRSQRVLGCIAGGSARADVARRLGATGGLLIAERDGVVVAVSRTRPETDPAPSGPDPGGPLPAA